MSRFDSCRSSVASSSSSLNSAWDERLSLRPEMEYTGLGRPLSDDSVSQLTETSSLQSLSSPFLGPRFDFDRASLPVNSRLKPQLRQNVSFGYEFNRKMRPVSTRSDRSCKSMFVKSPSWADFASPIPEDSTSSPIKVHTSPSSLASDTMEMDLYRMSLGNNMRKRHRSTNMERPKSPSVSLSLSDSAVQVSADIHHSSDIFDSHLLSEAAALPSHNSGNFFDNQSAVHIANQNSPNSSANDSLALSANHSPVLSANHSPVHSTSSHSSSQSANHSPTHSSTNHSSGYSADESSTNLDLDFTLDGAFWSPRSVGGSIFYIDEPGFRPISPRNDIASPSSIADSTASRFSYSDLPQIELQFVNEDDEVTHL